MDQQFPTLLFFRSAQSPGAKAARPLSGYPGLLPRWATLRFDEKLCRQKWCNIIIIAPKTIQNYSTQNDRKLWRQKLYKRFPLLRFDEKIWRQNNSQFFVDILPVFPLNHLVLKPSFSYLQGQRLRGLYPDIPAFYLAERPSQSARGHGRSWADLFTGHSQNLRWTRKVISNEYIDILFSDKANILCM